MESKLKIKHEPFIRPLVDPLVMEAIQKKANEEALIEWARRPVEVLDVAPPVPFKPWSKASVHAFNVGLTRFVRSCLP